MTLKVLFSNSAGRRIVAFGVFLAFLLTHILFPLRYADAQGTMPLPRPGVMVNLSPAFSPAILNGIKIDPQDPFRIDFILDKGNAGNSSVQLRSESTRLIRYFLAAVTVPENDLWVNLSPYEKDRIIPEAFGHTEMGRDLLAQDYMLKQVAASVIYPEGETGKAFWARVYAGAKKRYGSTDIPVGTLNKVWIVPEKAVVYEGRDSAYVVESRLKVMLEEDYRAIAGDAVAGVSPASAAGELGSDILREIVVPILEQEVNEGKNFALLRQAYHSLILAIWFKDRIKESLLGKAYMDQKKTDGVDIDDRFAGEKIWAQYVEAFRKGAFNYIKEEEDPVTLEPVPRKYFSGGNDFSQVRKNAYRLSGEATSPWPLPQSAHDNSMVVRSRLGLKERAGNPAIRAGALPGVIPFDNEKKLKKFEEYLQGLPFLHRGRLEAYTFGKILEFDAGAHDPRLDILRISTADIWMSVAGKQVTFYLKSGMSVKKFLKALRSLDLEEIINDYLLVNEATPPMPDWVKPDEQGYFYFKEDIRKAYANITYENFESKFDKFVPWHSADIWNFKVALLEMEIRIRRLVDEYNSLEAEFEQETDPEAREIIRQNKARKAGMLIGCDLNTLLVIAPVLLSHGIEFEVRRVMIDAKYVSRTANVAAPFMEISHTFAVVTLAGKKFIIDRTADQFEQDQENVPPLGFVLIPLGAHADRLPFYDMQNSIVADWDELRHEDRKEERSLEIDDRSLASPSYYYSRTWLSRQRIVNNRTGEEMVRINMPHLLMRNALARFRSNDQEGRLLGQLLIISRDVERHAVYISFPLDVQDKGVFRVKFVASPSGGKTPEVLVGFGRVRHLAIDPSSDPRRSGSYDAVLTLQDGSVRTIPLDENGQGIFSSRKKDGRAENAASGRVEKAMTNTMGAQSPGAIGLPDMALMNGIQNGGIDLARNRLGLRVHHSAEEMRFKFDPAMVERLQDASGLAPDIIGIQPMEVPVPVFLGLRAVSAAGMNNEGTSQVRGLRGCSGGTLGRQHKTGIV